MTKKDSVKIIDWDEIKNKDLDIVTSNKRRCEILDKIGYQIDEDGFLMDNKTKEKVLAQDKREINVNEDTNFALISGSHDFVRNLAEYSQLLTEKNVIKIITKK